MLRRLTRSTAMVLALALANSCSNGNLKETGAAPTPILEPVANPPQQGAQHYQGAIGGGVSIDMSVFLQLLGAGSGSVSSGATSIQTTAAHPTAAEPTTQAAATPLYDVTGSFTTSNGLQGTVQGKLQGTPESGLFDGSLKVLEPCEAVRKYTGQLTHEAIDWAAGAIVQRLSRQSADLRYLGAGVVSASMLICRELDDDVVCRCGWQRHCQCVDRERLLVDRAVVGGLDRVLRSGCAQRVRQYRVYRAGEHRRDRAAGDPVDCGPAADHHAAGCEFVLIRCIREVADVPGVGRNANGRRQDRGDVSVDG